jgi:hypothetical protein
VNRAMWINAKRFQDPGRIVMANLEDGSFLHFAFWRDFGNGHGCWESLDEYEMSRIAASPVALWMPYPDRPIKPSVDYTPYRL